MWAHCQALNVLDFSKEAGQDKLPKGEFVCLIITHLLRDYSMQGAAGLRI